MKRFVCIFALLITPSLPALAEEISMKDGTKIVGHMTAISADRIEVETAYGKMQLKRSDIVTISFPENNPNAAPAAGAVPPKMEAPKVEESLQGTRYVNKTGRFALTLPDDWMINLDIKRSPDTLTVLSSHDKLRFLMVIQEEYPGSVESYKELTQLNARKNLTNYEQLAESNVTIDGKPAVLVFYRGVLAKTNNLPVEFVSAIIASGSTYTKVTGWCVEPLFRDMQPVFEKMVTSYRTAGQTTASAGSSKP